LVNGFLGARGKRGVIVQKWEIVWNLLKKEDQRLIEGEVQKWKWLPEKKNFET